MAKRKKILRFHNKKNSEIHTEQMAEFLEMKKNEFEFKQQMLGIVKEQAENFLEMAEVGGLDFEEDPEAAVMFLDAPVDAFADEEDSPVLIYTATEGRTEYRLQMQMAVDQDTEEVSFTGTLFRTKGGELYQYDLEEGWIPARELSTLTERMHRILSRSDDDGEKAVLLVLMEGIEDLNDEILDDVFSTFRPILNLYEQVKRVCKIAMVEDGSTGEDEGVVVGLVPRNPSWDGISVIAEDGMYYLCQYISPEAILTAEIEQSDDEDLLFEDIPSAVVRRIIGTSNINDVSAALKSMLDHYYGEGDIHVLPLSLEAAMSCSSWTGPYTVETRETKPLSDVEKREKEQFRWIAEEYFGTH